MTDQEFQRLATLYLEGAIDEVDRRRLNGCLANSPARVRQFNDMRVLLGLIHEHGAGAVAARAPKVKRARRVSSVSGAAVWGRSIAVGVLAASLFLALGLSGWLLVSRDQTFARLESTAGCLWEESATPTREGQRVGTGHFRLAEGIAAIRFDNGVRVDLEGPAHVELLESDRCQLYDGKLVVTVENDFRGFTVETPNGRLIDQGTSFGVSVEENRESVVEVFDGRVDAVHRVSGESRRLDEEAAVRMLPTRIVDESEYTPPIEDDDTNQIQVTTATGRGSDCWVWRNPEKGVAGGPLLAVRTAPPKFVQFDRRPCLRFDLSGLPTDDVESVALRLTATPSGRGFASMTPDTTIAAYGVADDSLDAWSPDDISWSVLPGRVEEGTQLGDVRLLGRLTIPKGQQFGTFVVEGTAITELVRSDANGLVSIVLVSETVGGKGTLIHAFASSRHETLRPPTLELQLSK